MTETLLDAVDALTKPTVEHLSQTDDEGNWLRNHSVEHLPLLTALKNAINPSSNTAAGSSSLASTRNLIDSDAMFEYGKMTGAIGDWCRIYKVPITKDAITNLRQWYIAFELNPSDSGWHEKELRRWAGVIRNILEPPRKFEITVSCPVCGKDDYPNADGELVPHPLVGTYRLNEAGSVTNPRVTCRAVRMDDSGLQTPCGAEWDSFEAMEELGQEIQERHAG